MTESTRDVLDSIFSSDTGYSEIDRRALNQAPTYGEVLDFAEILTQSPSEEDLQVFIRDHPRFLLSMDGFADDSVLALLTKPPIGTNYYADFALLRFGQGGCCVHLVELEPADASLFTKKLSPARRYQDAITQVTDWNQWIRPNLSTFVLDLIDRAKLSPKYPERSANGSFRTRDSSSLEDCWRGFGGFDQPFIKFSIVIGRWARLEEPERKRLVTMNRNDGFFDTFTYDQLVRRGMERPFGHW